MKRWNVCLLGLLCCLSWGPPARADRDMLRVADKQALTTLDPGVTTSRLALVLYHNWNDGLFYRDPRTREILPCLARSYRLVGPGVLEVSLREGVRFHNGEPFEARAVAFSLEHLKGSGSTVASALGDLREVTVLDRYTLKVAFSGHVNRLLDILASMAFIYPPGYFAKVGPEAFGRHPVGTGPYRLVSFTPKGEILFEANPEYVPGPKPRPRIPLLKILPMEEDIPRMLSMINRDVDLIRTGTVYPEQVPFFAGHKDFRIATVSTTRSHFLIMDAMGRSGSPHFKDIRVRRAVNHAIDRPHLLKGVLEGYADPTASVICPSQFGYDAGGRHYAYDPSLARALLAEAGYPEGFTTDFHVFGSESVGEAIQGYLRDVGIRTRVRYVGGDWDALYEKLLRGEVPLAFATWGSYGSLDPDPLLGRFFSSRDPLCYGTSPGLERMIEKAVDTVETREREALYARALAEIAEEAFWVPLYCSRAITIMRRNLDFAPTSDGIDRYYEAGWVP